MSPFRGKGFRAQSSMRYMRPVSCPDSPRNSMMASSQEILSQDDSMVPNKPSVHFNIIPPVPRKRTAVKVLQSTLDDDTDATNEPALMDVSYQDRDMESFEIFSNEQMRSGNSSRRGSIRAIYPELPRMSSKPSPAPRRHIHKSLNNLDDETSTENELMLSAPLVNPRSYHKGLLRVVSSSGGSGSGGNGGGGNGNMSPSKIPRRKSSISISSGSFGGPYLPTSRKNSLTTASMDHLPQRRGQSISPKRKKSIDTGSSMIDLGGAPTRSSSRISKPTTLSPIIGTPNKDCQDDDDMASSSKCSATTDQSSPTKIPIRRNSNVNVNSRTSSQSNSQAGSREPSPPKWVSKSSPTKIPQKSNAKSSPSKTDRTMRAKKPTGDDRTLGRSRGTGSLATKEASSARKEPAITRERSSVKKPPAAAIKREPSTLKRQPSNLKRETSTLKRTPSNLKRENANLANKKTTQSTLHKNQSDSSLTKRIDKTNSFKQRRRTSSESDGLNEIDTANTSDKLISLSTSNAVSMTTAAIASQPVQITAAVTNQLNKTNSTSQIVNNNNNSSNANDNNNNINLTSNNVNDNDKLNRISSSSNLNANNAMGTGSERGSIGAAAAAAATMPSSDAQKTLEHMQKTGDADKMVDDAMTMEKGDASPADGMGEATTSTTPGPLMKKASTRTLGGKSDIGSTSGVSVTNDAGQIMNDIDSGLPHVSSSSAIETNVNVIEMTHSGHNNNNTSGSDTETMLRPSNDIDERQSERAAISVGPDVEVEGMNLANRTTNKLGHDNNGIGAHVNPSTGVKNEM